VEVLSDMRQTFRTSKGSYGFVIADPAGWRFKIFKYNEGGDLLSKPLAYYREASGNLAFVDGWRIA
jgi:hypothetical protein